jgi:hypothetical protein
MERPDLDEIISLLGESVDMIRTLRWRQDYFPEMGSPAHKAWINFHNPVGGPAYQAYHLAAGHLGAAEDNVLALELLLNEGSSSVAPFVVARASIEACGRAHLPLDPAHHMILLPLRPAAVRGPRESRRLSSCARFAESLQGCRA